MKEITEILETYSQLREVGMEANVILKTLRPKIEPLTKAQKDQLAASLRAYEGGQRPSAPAQPNPSQPRPKPVMKPVNRQAPPRPAVKPIAPVRPQPPTEDLPPVADAPNGNTCDNCGRINRPGEIFCINCGYMMSNVQDQFGTQQFMQDDDANDDVFRENMVLLLRLRDTDKVIPVRPQDYDHEVVVGRQDKTGIVAADVDLTPYGAERLGVSRMHMAISYDRANHRLTVTDLGSANGLYINGQKLVREEQRLLRKGDQLRLGRLVVDMMFTEQP